MASVTLENSYQSTALDMGDSHVKAHSKQHKYLQKDEPEIETLSENNLSDNSVDLALKMAQSQGVKNEDEWKKYNQHLRRDRRKNSYADYVAGIAGNLIKNKRRKLDDKKHQLGRQQREKIAQELAAVNRNNGVVVDGSLYYISNTIAYDKMKPDELKKYRQFERKTLSDFYHSKTFKELNPGCFRAEIHFDENGAIHLQTQSTWYHKDKRGRMTYAKRAEIRHILSKKYGSEQALNNRLDVLSHLHKITEKSIGKKTVASKYWELFNMSPDVVILDKLKVDKKGNKYPYKYTDAERTTRLVELWRMEQMKALGDIAKQNAKSMGVNWQLDEVYTTDLIHRTGSAYVEHKQSLKGVNKELDAQKEKLGQLSSDIDSKNKTIAQQGDIFEQNKAVIKKQLTAIQSNNGTISNQRNEIQANNGTLKSLRSSTDAKRSEAKDLDDKIAKKRQELSQAQERVQKVEKSLKAVVNRVLKAVRSQFEKWIDAEWKKRQHQRKPEPPRIEDFMTIDVAKVARDAVNSTADAVEKEQKEKRNQKAQEVEPQPQPHKRKAKQTKKEPEKMDEAYLPGLGPNPDEVEHWDKVFTQRRQLQKEKDREAVESNQQWQQQHLAKIARRPVDTSAIQIEQKQRQKLKKKQKQKQDEDEFEL